MASALAARERATAWLAPGEVPDDVDRDGRLAPTTRQTVGMRRGVRIWRRARGGVDRRRMLGVGSAVASDRGGARRRRPAASMASAGCRPGRPRCRRAARGPSGARAPGVKPEPGRLGQAALGLGDLAQLAAEADLAARHEVGRERPRRRAPRPGPARRRGRRRARRPARRPTAERVARRPRRSASSARSLEHGEQQRRAGRVSRPWAERRGEGRRLGGDQRLHLDEQRPVALQGGHDHRARTRPRGGRRGTAGSGRARRSRPPLGHLEQAELVGGAEAVLDRPQQAQRVVAVALEGEHGVDDVLEHPGPGEAALLGDVADEHDGDAAVLGRAARGGAAHSRTWTTEPGAEPSSGSKTVWMESTTTTSGSISSMWSRTWGSDGLRRQPQRWGAGRRGARPAAAPAGADSSAET